MLELFHANRIPIPIVEIDEINLRHFGSTDINVVDFLPKRGFTLQFGLRSGHYDEVLVGN